MSYVIAATYVVREGEAETVMDALMQVTPLSSLEPGNIIYRSHRSLEDPNVFFIYEEWVDEAAAALHVCTPHFERYIKGQAWPSLVERIVVRSTPLVA